MTEDRESVEYVDFKRLDPIFLTGSRVRISYSLNHFKNLKKGGIFQKSLFIYNFFIRIIFFWGSSLIQSRFFFLGLDPDFIFFREMDPVRREKINKAKFVSYPYYLLIITGTN